MQIKQLNLNSETLTSYLVLKLTVAESVLKINNCRHSIDIYLQSLLKLYFFIISIQTSHFFYLLRT